MSSTESPKLPWHPLSICLVTVLLSPLAGGIFQAINFGRLGRPALVRSALIVNIIVGALYILMTVRAGILNESAAAFLFLSLLIGIHFYRSQAGLYALARRPGASKRAVWEPVVGGLVATVLTIGIATAAHYLFFARFDEGQLALEAGDYTKAEAIFSEYKESTPKVPEVALSLAAVYANTDRIELAIAELRNSLRDNPRNRDLQSFLRELEEVG